jgi:hypothetical protein
MRGGVKKILEKDFVKLANQVKISFKFITDGKSIWLLLQRKELAGQGFYDKNA